MKKTLLLITVVVALVMLSSAATILVDSDNDGVIDQTYQEKSETKEFTTVELKVQAEGNEANADPGDTDNANILVLVTYKGSPVDFLTQDDFVLKTHLVPPGKCAVTVKEFHNKGDGAYTFEVVPITGCTWGEGEYDVQIIVSYEGIAAGQAIASIEVT